MSKRLLQIVTVLLALVPLITGAIGLSGVRDPLYVALGLPADPELDSNLRFFAGFWAGAGFALLWTVPKIESRAAVFRTIWAMIFLGGLGRLLSALIIGLPPRPFVGFTALEIIGAPLFVLWQMRVAKQAATP